MGDRVLRPVLRSVETIVVPDPKQGRVLVLRDNEGLTSNHAVVPMGLVPILARFDGDHSLPEIAEALRVPLGLVESLHGQLDVGLFLENARTRARRATVTREFREAAARPASHAGGAYHEDPEKLRAYLAEECIGKASAPAETEGAPRRLLGLVAPHIDPWRGALGYGHAYGSPFRGLPPQVDRVVVFGTSHAPMKRPFAFCKKAFDTPLGAVPCDADALDKLEKAARAFDPYADDFAHKREHSIDFQVVCLRHALGERPFTIVPILVGLGEEQVRGTEPAYEGLFDALGALAEDGRTLFVAGADLAHIGPRFGDRKALDESAREDLAAVDHASLSLAAEKDAPAFWEHVQRDLDTRRVCGLGPMYALLRSLGARGNAGELLHYEQNRDPDEGSIVSFAAMSFYA
jgi:AmmeMemoRadiSam system protein B